MQQLVWKTELTTIPVWQRTAIRGIRLIHAIARDLTKGDLDLQAMGLVYTTLLSLVPLLAVSFAVLKGFGVHNQVEPLLLSALEPLGEKSTEITSKIIGFVDNMNVRVLGSLGLVILLYTVISLIQKIEKAFNRIWQVPQTRSLANRFSQYLSVLMVGPVLFFAAVGLSTSIGGSIYAQTVMSIEPVGSLLDFIGRLVPYFMLTAAFAFVYVFVPNTRVSLRSATIGALVAAALWQTVGWGFATFMAGSTQYTAIYSGLAIAILFMIWVNIAWLILLVGSSIAFYHQHPEYLATRTQALRLSNRLQEHMALLVAGQVARYHYAGSTAWSSDTLAKDLNQPSSIVQATLDMLVTGDYLVQTAEEPSRYVPARASETIEVKAMLDFVRCFQDGIQDRSGMPQTPAIAEIEERVEHAIGQALAGLTLKDLAEGLGDRTSPVAHSVRETTA